MTQGQWAEETEETEGRDIPFWDLWKAASPHPRIGTSPFSPCLSLLTPPPHSPPPLQTTRVGKERRMSGCGGAEMSGCGPARPVATLPLRKESER